MMEGRAKTPLILASQSHARQSLLKQASISFESIPAKIDERAIQQASGMTFPGEIAAHLATKKAMSVSLGNPGINVIGADQTLSLGERLFTKPAGRAEAAEQLRALSGRTHHLHSAVAVVRDGSVLFANIDVAAMTMRTLEEDFIHAYLDAAGESVTTSVGAYQLEGLGVHLFERIDGDHFTILGLPMLPLLEFLRTEKLLAI